MSPRQRRLHFLVAAALTTTALAGCARGPRAPSPLHATPVGVLPLPGTANQRLAQSTTMTKALRGVIRNNTAWSTFWTRAAQDSGDAAAWPLPAVDFSREMLLVVGDGRRPAGHTIEIVGAASRGDTLFALVRIREDGPHTSADAARSPVAVVRVPRSDGPVVFRTDPSSTRVAGSG